MTPPPSKPAPELGIRTRGRRGGRRGEAGMGLPDLLALPGSQTLFPVIFSLPKSPLLLPTPGQLAAGAPQLAPLPKRPRSPRSRRAPWVILRLFLYFCLFSSPNREGKRRGCCSQRGFLASITLSLRAGRLRWGFPVPCRGEAALEVVCDLPACLLLAAPG